MSFDPSTGFGTQLSNFYVANIRSSDAQTKANALVAYSFLHDRRIPPHRAARVNALLAGSSAGPSDVMGAYQNKHIAPIPRMRDYETLDNECNFRQGCRHRPPAAAGTQFISIIRFGRKLQAEMVSLMDKRRGFGSLARILPPSSATAAERAAALHDYASQWVGVARSALPTTLDFQQFILLVTTAKTRVNGVQWTAPARQFDSSIAWLQRHHAPRDLGDDWLQVLGMPHYAGELLLLFRYTAVEAKRLYRPTHLDAGWYQHHFPSPVNGSPHDQGHTMHLAVLPGAGTPLVDEYIHRPVKLELAHLSAINGTTNAHPALDNLPALRQAQWQKLARRYPKRSLSHIFMPPDTGAIP